MLEDAAHFFDEFRRTSLALLRWLLHFLIHRLDSPVPPLEMPLPRGPRDASVLDPIKDPQICLDPAFRPPQICPSNPPLFLPIQSSIPPLGVPHWIRPWDPPLGSVHVSGLRFQPLHQKSIPEIHPSYPWCTPATHPRDLPLDPTPDPCPGPTPGPTLGPTPWTYPMDLPPDLPLHPPMDPLQEPPWTLPRTHPGTPPSN